MIKKRCKFSQINVFHPFLPHRIKVLLLSIACNFIHVYREKWKAFSAWYFSSIHVQLTFSNYASNAATGWPYRFRSRGTTGSSSVGPRCWHFCVVVDVSRCLDTLTWVQADTASAVCGLTLTPITFAAVICDDDGPCLVNAAHEPESPFTMSPRSTTRPLYFWNLGSNSEFLRWHMSFRVEK